MSSLWHSDGGEWAALEPAGFPDETSLHQMVASSPQLLPLSGQPEVVVLGSGVPLGGGYADVVGVEVGGRPVIVEVKLARNSEARRAVVAQALAYAAVLHGLTVEELERDVLLTVLARAGHRSIRAACEAADPALLPAQDEFEETLASSLERGHVRIVFVLDRAPRELVRLVGYLEAITEGLVIDLITVAQYRVGDELVVVPTRVDPERPVADERARTAGSLTRARGAYAAGSRLFVESLDGAPAPAREATMRIVEWARALQEAGAAQPMSYLGTGDAVSLQLRLPGMTHGIVSVAHSDGGPRLYVYGSVVDRHVPQMRERLQLALGLDEIRQGSAVGELTERKLDAIADAYRAAAGAPPATPLGPADTGT